MWLQVEGECMRLEEYKKVAKEFLESLGYDPERWKEIIELKMLAYLDLGFSVIPVRLLPQKPEYEKLLKTPLVLWSEYAKRLPTREEIEKWIETFEYFNIAIVTGKISNLIALDIDDKSKILPYINNIKTAINETGKGFQILFRGVRSSEVIVSDELRKKFGLPDIRIKGEGGIIVVPPSIHPSGVQYKWLKPLEQLADISYLDEVLELVDKVYEISKYKNQLTGQVTAPISSTDWKVKALQLLKEVQGREHKYLEIAKEKINWDALPPCIKKAIEDRKKDVHGHEKNVFLRDFFMTILHDSRLVYALFWDWSKNLKDFDPETTAYQIVHWWKSRYLPLNCFNADKSDDVRKIGYCVGCELMGKIKNPLTYYRWKSRGDVVVSPREKIEEEVPEEFKPYTPYATLRKDQSRLVREIISLWDQHKDAILNPPTGYGKTYVYIVPSKIYANLGYFVLIVTRDRYLQKQIGEYGAIVVMGKDNYECPIYKIPVSRAPCSVRKSFECDTYCEWRHIQDRIKNAKKYGGIVVANQGNWLRFLKYADRIIVDEYDKTVEAMCRPRRIVRVTDKLEENIQASIELAKKKLEQCLDEIEKYDVGSEEYMKLSKKIAELRNRIFDLQFVLENIDHAFDYSDKNGRWYVELDIIGTLQYIDKISKAPKLWVSATPIKFKDMPILTTDYRVADRTNAPIIYVPITKLTCKATRGREQEIFPIVADFINLEFKRCKETIGTKKAIVYTANTTSHIKIADYLDGKCLIHTKDDDIHKTIEEFKKGDYDFLVGAGFEAGVDFFEDDINLLFIVKVPYPYLGDPKWDGFRKKFGEERFNKEYVDQAVRTLEQLCGRIARSEEKISLTYILDEKFEELYRGWKNLFSVNFRERLVGLGEEGGSDAFKS